MAQTATTTTVPPAASFDSAALYAAHPYLDPDLFARDRFARLYFARLFRDQMRNDWHYSRLLNRLLHPLEEEQPPEVNERILASYLTDATTYLREVVSMLPAELQSTHHLDEAVAECDDLRRLGQMLFEPHAHTRADARRRRYEVQRKLYLTKLLIHIDNTRMVQDGPRHRRYVLDVLEKKLWAFVKDMRDHEARYDVADNDLAAQSEAWRFRVRRIVRQLPGITYDIDVYHFDIRFKQETAGFEYTPGREAYEVAQRTRWGQMQRSRSGSIISKMLRKSINDPAAITDMLGVKFIVGNETDVHKLADLLHQILGGPFSYRNQVDLFRRPQDHDQLNRFSSREFRAFKEDLDILFPASESQRARPYSFALELQVLTLDSFLRTVHSRDYVSHSEYKRRQFLQGVLPCIFPASVYGETHHLG